MGYCLTPRDKILDVQTAFFLRFRLPPPASGPLVFVRGDGSCAGLAANGYKTSAMQRIERCIVRSNVVPDVCERQAANGLNFCSVPLLPGILHRSVCWGGRPWSRSDPYVDQLSGIESGEFAP